jgi:hypothetical protein
MIGTIDAAKNLLYLVKRWRNDHKETSAGQPGEKNLAQPVAQAV